MKQASQGFASVMAVLIAAVASAQTPPEAPAESAEEARYEVELIVFRHLDQSRNTPEIPAAGSLVQESPLTLVHAEDPAISFLNSLRPQTTGAGNPALSDSAVPRTPADDGRKRGAPEAGFLVKTVRAEYPDFVPINAESFALNNIYRRLESLDAYQPIAHLGWIQPVRDAPDAIGYRLAPNPDAIGGVSGTITLYKSRFLHLALELSLDDAGAYPDYYARGVMAGARDADRPSYKLEESRRIRQTNLHYFDHPLFGVIARIEKIAPDATADADTDG